MIASSKSDAVQAVNLKPHFAAKLRRVPYGQPQKLPHEVFQKRAQFRAREKQFRVELEGLLQKAEARELSGMSEVERRAHIGEMQRSLIEHKKNQAKKAEPGREVRAEARRRVAAVCAGLAGLGASDGVERPLTRQRGGEAAQGDQATSSQVGTPDVELVDALFSEVVEGQGLVARDIYMGEILSSGRKGLDPDREKRLLEKLREAVDAHKSTARLQGTAYITLKTDYLDRVLQIAEKIVENPELKVGGGK